MRRVSKRRAVAMRIYAARRRVFLENRPKCEFPGGCEERATTVQHLRGRNGARLLDEAWWAASCWPHNEWAETHTGDALACGWLVRINSNVDEDNRLTGQADDYGLDGLPTGESA